MTEIQLPTDEAQSPVVYVRPVDVAHLPARLRAEVGDLETLYALHRPNGDQLALVRDRKLAFALARQNHFEPVSVH